MIFRCTSKHHRFGLSLFGDRWWCSRGRREIGQWHCIGINVYSGLMVILWNGSFDRVMLRLWPLSFVYRVCHPETAGSRRTGTNIESIMGVTCLSHNQSRLVTYVTDCYSKVGPNFFLVQQSWTNFCCWSNKKLDQQLATLYVHLFCADGSCSPSPVYLRGTGVLRILYSTRC